METTDEHPTKAFDAPSVTTNNQHPFVYMYIPVITVRSVFCAAIKSINDKS